MKKLVCVLLHLAEVVGLATSLIHTAMFLSLTVYAKFRVNSSLVSDANRNRITQVSVGAAEASRGQTARHTSSAIVTPVPCV